MKALVIAPQPFFTPRGTPFSVYYRTMVTAEMGVEIDLLTYGEGQDVAIPGTRIIRIPRFAFLGNAKTGPSLLKLFLDMFIFMRALGLLLTNKYDFVHAHEESIFFCRLLKPLFRYKLVYDMHSSLPQQLTNFNFTESRILIKLFTWLEDSSLHASDAIITICPALAEYVDNLITDRGKHFLIENSIFDPVRLSDQSNTNTGNINTSEPKRQDNDGPLIVYAGTLEHYQGIDILLEGFAIAHKENSKLRMIIAGGSEEQVAHYRAMASQLGLDNICVFTGRVPQAEAKNLMNSASVLSSPRTEGNNTPLKVYEILASGIPMIATNIFSHTQVLTDEVAFMVEPTREGLAKGILDSTSSPDEVARRVGNARQLYEEKYSRKAYEANMRKLLNRIACAV